jgi:hypothetical protein
MAATPSPLDTRQSLTRERRLSRCASYTAGPTKYIDLIAVDDGSASQTTQSGGGLDQWVPEHEWTPGFRWLQKSIVEWAPYVRVMLYRPNSLDATPLQWRSGFFLSQIESRREGAATRPVMFIAYGKRAALVRQAIIANENRAPKSLHGIKSSVLVLGVASQPRRIRFLETTYKDLLNSYEVMSDWRPPLRLALVGTHPVVSISIKLRWCRRIVLATNFMCHSVLLRVAPKTTTQY